MRLIISLFVTLMIMTTHAWAESRFVQRVEDGNTLILLNGERVKLIGIDPPHKVDNPQANLDAADFIRGLVSGTVVELEYDIEKSNEHGQLLAYVWVRFDDTSYFETLDIPENYIVQYKGYETGDGAFYVFLNATVIKSGYAKPIKNSPNLKYAKLFQNLFQQRKIDTAGIYPVAEGENKIATQISSP